MALKEYFWNGKTYQFADEDLKHYPGAVPVKEEAPVKPEPQTKSKKPQLTNPASRKTNENSMGL